MVLENSSFGSWCVSRQHGALGSRRRLRPIAGDHQLTLLNPLEKGPWNRKAALSYAERFWDRPCDDGEIMLNERAIRVGEERTRLNAPENDGWEARFVYNGKPPSDPDFGDEAVFIKKLPAGETGGVNIPDLPGTWLKKTIQDWAGLNDCAIICRVAWAKTAERQESRSGRSRTGAIKELAGAFGYEDPGGESVQGRWSTCH